MKNFSKDLKEYATEIRSKKFVIYAKKNLIPMMIIKNIIK